MENTPALPILVEHPKMRHEFQDITSLNYLKNLPTCQLVGPELK